MWYDLSVMTLRWLRWHHIEIRPMSSWNLLNSPSMDVFAITLMPSTKSWIFNWIYELVKKIEISNSIRENTPYLIDRSSSFKIRTVMIKQWRLYIVRCVPKEWRRSIFDNFGMSTDFDSYLTLLAVQWWSFWIFFTLRITFCSAVSIWNRTQ